MTLDEAIKHCEEKVKELRTEAEHEKHNQLNKVKMFNGHFPADYTKANKCLECAAENQQLAEWLKELKALKENNGDLISRSEAEKLGATCLARRNENGQLEAIISLDNAPTVCGNNPKWCENCVSKGKCASTRQTGEWVPVSERLPDKNGIYLCTVDYGEEGVVVAQRLYWDTLGGFEKQYNKNDRVIAWQPLPEPYKKGGAK